MHLLAQHNDSSQVWKQYLVFFFSNQIALVERLLNLANDKVHIVDICFFGFNPFFYSFIAIEWVLGKFFPMFNYFMDFDSHHDPLKDFCGKFTVNIIRWRSRDKLGFLCLLHSKKVQFIMQNTKFIRTYFVKIIEIKRTLLIINQLISIIKIIIHKKLREKPFW